MSKNNTFAAMKSLLVSGYTLLIWGMIPLFLASTFTSCGKLEELLGGEDEDEDYNYPNNYYEVATNDGADPYFELETTSITLPAIRNEEGVEVSFHTNIVDLYYVLEKYKESNAKNEKYFPILETPESSFYHPEGDTFTESLIYYTNYTNEKQTDNLLIYSYNNDSLLATIPIEQEVGPCVNVTQSETTINSITLTLEGQNEATYYSAFVSQDTIPFNWFIDELSHGGNSYFESTYSLKEQPTITFSNLEEATKYYVYVQGGTDPKSMCGISQYVITTPMRSKEDALIMKYKLTELNGHTVYLPFEGQVKGVIDWGDGTTETIEPNYYSSASLSHTYKESTSSTATVTFKGTVENLTTNSGSAQGETLKASLQAITQWGNPELKSINLQGAIALEQVASDTKGALANVTDFSNCFYGCSNLNNLPEGLFAKAINATNFDYTFYGCTSLTTLPSDLFAHNTEVTSFQATFSGCTSLTELPEGLFAHNTQTSNVSQAFYECKQLNKVPVTLFDHMRMLQNTNLLFYNCTSLTGESPYTVINGQKVHLYERQSHLDEFLRITNPYETYVNCTKLTDYGSIPSDWK